LPPGWEAGVRKYISLSITSTFKSLKAADAAGYMNVPVSELASYSKEWSIEGDALQVKVMMVTSCDGFFFRFI
jgi:hypothetical protein